VVDARVDRPYDQVMARRQTALTNTQGKLRNPLAIVWASVGRFVLFLLILGVAAKLALSHGGSVGAIVVLLGLVGLLAWGGVAWLLAHFGAAGAVAVTRSRKFQEWSEAESAQAEGEAAIPAPRTSFPATDRPMSPATSGPTPVTEPPRGTRERLLRRIESLRKETVSLSGACPEAVVEMANGLIASSPQVENRIPRLPSDCRSEEVAERLGQAAAVLRETNE
jgi:hypothetical protein